MAKDSKHDIDQEAKPGATQTNWESQRNVTLQEFDKEVLLVRDYDAVRINSLLGFDAVIIEYHIPEKADNLIKRIRASVVEEIYLMPIYVLATINNIVNTTLELIDGKLDRVDLKAHKEEIESIQRYIGDFKQIQSDFVGKNLLLKLLRYLLSRDKSLKPIPTHLSLTGYSYPFLEASIEQNQYGEINSIFDVAVERGFLTPTFVDTVHLCSKCHSGFINYREICPKCQTRNLTQQHSIHHFVCGYVGPEADFYQDNKLVCPKCSRQLRHIGVDYDKPSVVIECENGHVFQEPEMETFCLRCHDVNSLDSILDYQVNEYTISNTGIGIAKSGNAKQEQPAEIQGIITYPLFKALIRLEGERQKITNSSISVSYVNFMFSTPTMKKQLNNYKEFIIDIIMLFRNLIQPTDIITIPVEDIILVFSPESNAKDTKKRLGQTLDQVKSSLIKNNKLNSEDQFFVESFDMTLEIGSEGVLAQINEEVNIQ